MKVGLVTAASVPRPGGEAFDEVRLARAEVAAEREHVAARAACAAKVAAEGDGRFRAGQNGRSHLGEVDEVQS